jgi:hypothetical protein
MKHHLNFRDLERTHGINWHELVDLEPKLAQLLWEAHRTGAPCRRCLDVDQAFTPVRNALTRLVGFAGKNRWHPVLGSPAAYDVAYWKLYDAVAALVPPVGAEPAEQEQQEGIVSSIGAKWPRYVPLPAGLEPTR